MVTYHIMDATRIAASCLHSGPMPLASCQSSNSLPAYVETVSDIVHGSVKRKLSGICERYGTCGVLAVDKEIVVGKLRAYPQALIDRVPYPCVQQEGTIRPIIELNVEKLPTLEEYPVLHLYCIQVTAEYCGQGIAGVMLDTLIAWARSVGWRELRARAVNHIPPLLAWCGQLSRQALERRGFSVVSESLSKELREGVVSQRGGYHGDGVLRQWDLFAHLSIDEAAMVYEMRCDLA